MCSALLTNIHLQVAQLCQREVKKFAQKSQRTSKEVSVQPRARRLMREALMYWRKYERTEKEQRRKAEKEAVEQRKIDDEMREVGTGSLQGFIQRDGGPGTPPQKS